MSVVSTCRLSEQNETIIQDALDESGMLKSELMRRAVRYYMVKNPDGFRAFAPVSGKQRSMTYDPVEDLM